MRIVKVLRDFEISYRMYSEINSYNRQFSHEIRYSFYQYSDIHALYNDISYSHSQFIYKDGAFRKEGLFREESFVLDVDPILIPYVSVKQQIILEKISESRMRSGYDVFKMYVLFLIFDGPDELALQWRLSL